MATQEQWRLVEWDQDAASACTLELRARVEVLEAAQNLRQDEDVGTVAGDPQPIATVEELLRCYGWAFMEAVQKGDATSEAAELAHRAVYELGRKHGAAANSKPTPNDRQIRSSVPAVGLVEGLGSVPDVWSEGKPLHPAARRAAIHHIADWLELQQEVPIGVSADYFAARLREEAGR